MNVSQASSKKSKAEVDFRTWYPPAGSKRSLRESPASMIASCFLGMDHMLGAGLMQR